jgi:LysM repeat protein
MKRIIFTLTIVTLCAGLLFSPVSAAVPYSGLSSETCGDTYVVKHLDNLYKIARLCGTTVANILALNPQITNPNIIFTGQVLRLSGSAPQPVYYATTYTVQSGDTLESVAAKFGITVWALKAANPVLYSDSTLRNGQVLSIPSSYTWNPVVTLSATTAEPGDIITVYVRGFPAKSWIDYRVGESGQDYSVVYDGTVASDGTDTQEITIPYAADDGEYWVVFVTTTSQKEVIAVYSAKIYIDE